VNFRRIFDPRLTEEYQVVGEPYSRQSGDGEIAAMQIGASLWGAANQTVETMARSHIFEKPYVIGNQYGYPQGGGTRNENLKDSPIAGLARAIGLLMKDYQDVIHVNQAGLRFVNEAATGFDWWNPCLELNGGTGEGGGPIWAIFDADAAKREGPGANCGQIQFVRGCGEGCGFWEASSSIQDSDASLLCSLVHSVYS
jgi:hypothetical protein